MKQASDKPLEKIRDNLKKFIDLAEKDDVKSWMDWISTVARKVQTKCWAVQNCGEMECPAYKNKCGRCWIIAGTMMTGEAQCKLSKKYQTCKKCRIYKEHVCKDAATEIEEYLIVLFNLLKCKQQELNDIATIDFLTNIHNRRFFDSYLQKEYHRLKRSRGGITLIMIDINDFKDINDTLGHVAGDKILIECSRLIAATARESDIVARYGGDEFIVILGNDCNCDNNKPESFIARLEKQLDKRNCKKTGGVAISLSYGFAKLTADQQIKDAISTADRNMYLDKQHRKHQLTGEQERPLAAPSHALHSEHLPRGLL